MWLKIIDTILLAGKNILRSGLRTVLCIIAICIGITSVSTVSGIGSSAQDLVNQEMEQIGISGIAFYNNKSLAVSQEALAVVSQVAGVKATMPLAIASGTIKLRNIRSNAGILGIDQSLSKVFHLMVLHGSLPTEREVRNREKVAVIDADLARLVYQRTNVVGKEIRITVDDGIETFRICAVIQSQSSSLEAIIGNTLPYIVYIPYTTLEDLSPSAPADKIAIAADQNDDQEALAQAVVHKLNQLQGETYKYENLNQYLSSFSSITGIVTMLVSGIAAISVIVGGIGVMNAMVASIEARFREVGIYRALGAKKRDIVRMFLFESVLICLIGGLLGMLISKIIFVVIAANTSYQIAFHLQDVLVSLGISGVSGVVFGILPAVRAAKLNPINAMRWE